MNAISSLDFCFIRSYTFSIILDVSETNATFSYSSNFAFLLLLTNFSSPTSIDFVSAKSASDKCMPIYETIIEFDLLESLLIPSTIIFGVTSSNSLWLSGDEIITFLYSDSVRSIIIRVKIYT